MRFVFSGQTEKGSFDENSNCDEHLKIVGTDFTFYTDNGHCSFLGRRAPCDVKLAKDVKYEVIITTNDEIISLLSENKDRVVGSFRATKLKDNDSMWSDGVLVEDHKNKLKENHEYQVIVLRS
ncbi:hypothetical protein L1267_19005 [Pseudoalteromonas sp. OFAV1]|uniref:hypothetical protein n=1 Tax=Pseudoalteromonas sp. OFAV1 TaxID=2908892 RepID=UPI001F2C205A|nr:hypothetical protein [Pseudoalteromonas sp. OFAV1]MCF2902463.1 hypothetical protein [Pseudoalteromonas sp. OFAV1]